MGQLASTSASLQMAVRGKHHGRPGTPELAVTAKDQTLVLEVTVPDHGSSNLTGIEYRYQETTGGAYSILGVGRRNGHQQRRNLRDRGLRDRRLP